jgi:hypothetical protein
MIFRYVELEEKPFVNFICSENKNLTILYTNLKGVPNIVKLVGTKQSCPLKATKWSTFFLSSSFHIYIYKYF